MDRESSCCLVQDIQHHNRCGCEEGQKNISETIGDSSRKRKDDTHLKLLDYLDYLKTVHQLTLQKLTQRDI